LLKGHVFSDQDRRHSPPVAIINQKMARTYWPGENPIGKRFRFTRSEPWLTVIGVTGDVRRQGIEREIAPQVFRPHRQGSDDMMDVIVRTTAEPTTVAAAIRNQIQAIDKTVAKFNVVTADHQLGEQVVERRFDLFLISAFAFAALFLSAIGIYGLLHQVVAQRTNEVGIRMALGASQRAVTILMLRQGLTLACLGTLIGLVGSLSVSWLLSKFLYGITPTDPISFGCSVLVLLLAGGIACWIPSRRAARIDPMLVLRQD
jgi:predicted permease